MSLLLDALKKAADDKQKASQKNSPAKENIESPADEKARGTVPVKPVELDIPQLKDEELTLEEVEQISSVEEIKEKAEESEEEKERELKRLASLRSQEVSQQEKKPHRVSDEALSLLIHKTNRDVKHGRRILITGMLIASIAILVVGGIFYYKDMQIEIAMLERKHELAMRTMQSRTNKENLPDKTLIKDSKSDGNAGGSRQFVNKQQSTKPTAKHVQGLKSRRQNKVDVTSANFSIQKTNKKDPVGERLNDAWLAYENGRYAEAKSIYNDALLIETNNRDALLGLGAIAIIEKDSATARKVYLTLLKQDPRDPIASAALASLKGDKTTIESDETYLLSMLEKTPDAPQLNFALGNNYAQQNKWKHAQQSYFKAWQADNDNADYIYNLAISMDQLNKHQQAIQFYRDSLLKSRNKRVIFSRAEVEKRIVELSEL